MLIKKNKQQTLPFNLSLNKQFSKQYLSLKKEDESASMQAIHMLGEYIRYCLFEDYRFKNKNKLSKYCRLLLKYEVCSKAMLVKCCKNRCLNLIKESLRQKATLQTVNLYLCLKESKNLAIAEAAENALTIALGTTIRGVST